MGRQLEIQFISQEAIDYANRLLESVNECEKNKYEPHGVCAINNVVVFEIYKKGSSTRLYNCVTQDGKTPEGMSANWRVIDHVINELKRKK